MGGGAKRQRCFPEGGGSDGVSYFGKLKRDLLHTCSHDSDAATTLLTVRGSVLLTCQWVSGGYQLEHWNARSYACDREKNKIVKRGNRQSSRPNEFT